MKQFTALSNREAGQPRRALEFSFLLIPPLSQQIISKPRTGHSYPRDRQLWATPYQQRQQVRPSSLKSGPQQQHLRLIVHRQQQVTAVLEESDGHSSLAEHLTVSFQAVKFKFNREGRFLGGNTLRQGYINCHATYIILLKGLLCSVHDV